jgi:hypothetical protein
MFLGDSAGFDDKIATVGASDEQAGGETYAHALVRSIDDLHGIGAGAVYNRLALLFILDVVGDDLGDFGHRLFHRGPCAARKRRSRRGIWTSLMSQ